MHETRHFRRPPLKAYIQQAMFWRVFGGWIQKVKDRYDERVLGSKGLNAQETLRAKRKPSRKDEMSRNGDS